MVFSLVDPSKREEYAKILRRVHFRKNGTMIMSSAFYDPPTEMSDPDTMLGNISMTYGFGTQAVPLVEVDEETGSVDVLKIVAVHDAGRILTRAAPRGRSREGS